MRKSALFLIILFLVALAGAEERRWDLARDHGSWVYLSYEPVHGSHFYYDTSLLDKEDHVLWLKIVKEPEIRSGHVDLIDDEYAHYLLKLSVDCRQDEARPIEAKRRDIFMRRYETEKVTAPAWELVPGTEGAYYHELVC